MNDMTPAIGHNNAPDPIDEALAPFGDAISEAENWLDGTPVEDEPAMNAVDLIIKDVRKAKTELAKAKKSATAPLYDAWKAEGERWKPTEEDLERRLKGLVAIVDPFKRKLADEKEAAKRAAYAEARRKDEEARKAQEQANAGNYEKQAEADRLQHEAIEAKKAAAVANKDTTKGLRTVTRYEIENHRAALNDILANDKPALTAFIEEYTRLNHKARAIAGVRVWTEKEAF